MSIRSTSLEPKSQLTINLDPGWECPSSPSEEKKKKKKKKFPIKYRKKTKEKESSRSKIGRKLKKKIPNQRLEESKIERKILDRRSKENKRNIQKGLCTRQYLNNTELSQENEKRKETTTWSGPLPLIANQNPVRWRLSRPALNKNYKGKGQNTRIQISHQKHYSQKSPIDPWSYM